MTNYYSTVAAQRAVNVRRAADAADAAGLTAVAAALAQALDCFEICADAEKDSASEVFFAVAEMAVWTAAVETASLLDAEEIRVEGIPPEVLSVLRVINYEPASSTGRIYEPGEVESWFFDSLIDSTVLYDQDGEPAAVQFDIGTYRAGGVAIVDAFGAVTAYAGGTCFPLVGTSRDVVERWTQALMDAAGGL